VFSDLPVRLRFNFGGLMTTLWRLRRSWLLCHKSMRFHRQFRQTYFTRESYLL